MPNKPLVSICIITYNQIDFVRETLSSALDQDYTNLEVVVADDDSTDGTVEVILAFAEKYPDRLIPLVGGPNLGITGNSNRALNACKGKYIAFQGGDDVLLPNKIKRQVEWMDEDEVRILCGHAVERIDVDGNFLEKQDIPAWTLSGAGADYFIKYGNPFAATSVMVRASSIPDYGFDERLPVVSDWKLWLDCLSDGGVYGAIPGELALYREHPFGITKAKRTKCYYEAFKTLLILMFERPKLFPVLLPNLVKRFGYFVASLVLR